MMVELCGVVWKHISGKDCWQKEFCVFHGSKGMVGCRYKPKMSEKEKKAEKLASKKEFERLERIRSN